MPYVLNRTEAYHQREMNHLGWEVTVCNSMENQSSPVRRILSKNATYGELLLDHLDPVIRKHQTGSVLEVGGGYGFLMRDFLLRYPEMTATMVDIAPAMMARQKETLNRYDVRFVLSDFFELDPALLQQQDLVILNEIVGDFPCACNLTKSMVDGHDESPDPYLQKIRQHYESGRITLPDSEPFNLNIGAIQAVDRLCTLGIPMVFISEHSCEAAAFGPMASLLFRSPTGNPEEIKLIGHSEYTIRFSDLEAMAKSHKYTVIRGNYADFIDVPFSDELVNLIECNAGTDDYEIILHFIDELFVYEYLLLLHQDFA